MHFWLTVLFQLITSCAFTIISQAQTINTNWSFQIGGLKDDRGIKVIQDFNGNLYFAGIIEDEAYYSNSGVVDTISGFGKEDIIFGKLNSNGNILWLKLIGGRNIDDPTDITINIENEIYLSGIFKDTLYIGLDTIISSDYIDSFVAKFDSLGNMLWVNQLAGLGNQQCISLQSDIEGNLLSTGYFSKSIEFPPPYPGPYQAQGESDGFTAKWTSTGDLIWVNFIKGSGKSIVKDILMDANNDYYIIGDYTDSLAIGNSISNEFSYGKTDVFIIKYSNSGILSWAQTLGSINDDKAKRLTLGGNGKMIFIGEFKEDLKYNDDILLSSDGGDDIFQLTFNKNGHLQHRTKQGEEKNDFLFDAWVPVGQKILMASDLRINLENENTILANYDILGNMSDVFLTGEDCNPTILSAVMPTMDQIFICGTFHETAIFNQVSLISHGEEDFFIIKMQIENETVLMMDGDSSDIPYHHMERAVEYDLYSDIGEVLLNQNTDYLFYNYPNPFKETTHIIYYVPETCDVLIQISNINGQILKDLEFKKQSSGYHNQIFNGEQLEDGVYLCNFQMKAHSKLNTKRIKLIHIK